MIIGGYSMEDDGVHGITVKQRESGWSFFLDGDDAEIFRCEWKLWELRTGESFEDFLYAHDYNTLLNQEGNPGGLPERSSPFPGLLPNNCSGIGQHSA